MRRAYSQPRALPKFPEGTEKTISSPLLCQLGVCVDVVDALRHDPAEVDGVGRGQIELRKPGVGEGLLHQVLAVVELAVHGQGQDVVADRVELLLLHPADFVSRVEDPDADPLDALEGLADGASRVARGGHEHVEPLSPVAQTAHEPRHHPCGKILEGSRGPLVETHDVHALTDPLQGNVEVVGILDDLPDHVPGQFLFQERLRHEQRGLGVRGPLERQDVIDGEPGNGLRHEEPLVGRLALDQGIAEGDLPPERREAGHPVESAVRAVVADHGTTSVTGFRDDTS